MNNKPKISVITITYNAEKYIEQTINSVVNQTYNNIEYLVIDGKSTDKTLAIVEKYSDSIDLIISEPDEGIANAMNKGIKHATGDFLIFLHADDYFYSNEVLHQAAQCIDDNIDILLAEIQFGKKLKHYVSRGLNFWMNFKTGVFHQGALCHRRLFQSIGDFDESIDIAMDYDFFLRAYRHNATWSRCPIILSVMRDTGISSRVDWTSLLRRFQDEKKIHKKNSTTFLMNMMYFFYWLFYLPYRRTKYLLR